jgi:hypothetical protein
MIVWVCPPQISISTQDEQHGTGPERARDSSVTIFVEVFHAHHQRAGKTVARDEHGIGDVHHTLK